MPVEPITDKKEVQSSVDNKVAEKKPEYVKPSIASRDIKVNFAKPWLLNESDVDDYLKAMRDALLNEINTVKRINF